MIALWDLTDRPEQARWLPQKERTWLAGVMSEEHRLRATVHGSSQLRALLSGRVLLICCIYFLNTLVTYGVFLWLPRILREVSGLRGFSLSAFRECSGRYRRFSWGAAPPLPASRSSTPSATSVASWGRRSWGGCAG
jgi:hypothetical protein